MVLILLYASGTNRLALPDNSYNVSAAASRHSNTPLSLIAFYSLVMYGEVE